MQCKDKCLITERSPEVITYNITENWIYELLTTGEVCVSRQGCFWRYWGHCLHICLHICLHTLEMRFKSLLQLPLCFQVLGCTLETNTDWIKCCEKMKHYWEYARGLVNEDLSEKDYKMIKPSFATPSIKTEQLLFGWNATEKKTLKPLLTKRDLKCMSSHDHYFC